MHGFMRHAARAFAHLREHAHDGCGHHRDWQRWGQAWEGHGDEGFEGGFGGGGLGVRRPLRFLAHRLGLDEHQVAELARILNELKTERAQAEVDRRRTVAALADAVGSETFDAAKATEGGDLRVKSAERVRDAVLKALREIHAVLNPQQRTQLAYLIRTGTLMI
jgi:Spy/CpxP family protein refolding chaperone